MSYTTTTRENDARFAALREACAEIVREEAAEFRETETAGVVFDRRYLARRRAFLRGERYPILKFGRRYLPHLAACLAIAVLAGGVMWHRMADPKATESAGTVGDGAMTEARVPTGATMSSEVDGVSTTAGAGLSGDAATIGGDRPIDPKSERREWESFAPAETLERGGVHLTISVSERTAYLRDMTSELTHVTVTDVGDGVARENVRAILYGGTAFPNAVSLTFEEGIHYLSFGWGDDASADRFPQLEVLNLPATLKNIYCSTDLMMDLVRQDLSVLYPALATSGGNFWTPAEEMSGYRCLYYTFPPVLTNLKRITVAAENECFWDEAGMLYSDCFVMLDADEYPTRQLLCLPRNYEGVTEVGGLSTVTLPEGTDYIHTGAVYQCNIDRLVIPATVTRIAPAAIVATADRPLTVVGEKGSAAEEYVRLFGERYYLRFELPG